MQQTWVVLAKGMNATVTSRQQSIAFGHIHVVLTTAEKNHTPIRKGRERKVPFLPRHPSRKTKHLPVYRGNGGEKKTTKCIGGATLVLWTALDTRLLIKLSP